MNLTKLFEMQGVLDERIVKDKGLEGQNLLPEKILALQVELGELANEWRGFKFWSEDREPRVGKPTLCEFCNGTAKRFKAKDPKSRKKHVELIRVDCNRCKGGYWGTHNPLLEEYVDCLHFILSIGNELGVNPHSKIERSEGSDRMTVFAKINRYVAELWWECHDNTSEQLLKWFFAFSNLITLGELLGFSEEDIKRAYFEKNRINHERQSSNY